MQRPDYKHLIRDIVDIFLSGIEQDNIHFLGRPNHDLVERIRQGYVARSIDSRGYAEHYFGEGNFEKYLERELRHAGEIISIVRSELLLAISNTCDLKSFIGVNGGIDGFFGGCYDRFFREMRAKYPHNGEFSAQANEEE